MNRVRNRQLILTVIKKRKALEKGDINLSNEEYEAPWASTPHALNYWKFLKDLEEGRIKHLDGRKIG